MKAIVKEPGMSAQVVDIKNNYKELQAIVGGYIECVPMDYNKSSITIVLNEEGKLIGLAPNAKWYNDILCGTLIFVGVGGEDFTSLSEDQIEEVKAFLDSNSLIY